MLCHYSRHVFHIRGEVFPKRLFIGIRPNQHIAIYSFNHPSALGVAFGQAKTRFSYYPVDEFALLFVQK